MITRDKDILYRRHIVDTIFEHAARVIVIRNKNYNGASGARFLVDKAPLMHAFAQCKSPPFVAGLRQYGPITEYEIEHRRSGVRQVGD